MTKFNVKLSLQNQSSQTPNLPGQLVQCKQCFNLHVIFLLQVCTDFMTSQNLE